MDEAIHCVYSILYPTAYSIHPEESQQLKAKRTDEFSTGEE